MLGRIRDWWNARHRERSMPFSMEEFRAALETTFKAKFDATQTTRENSEHWKNADNLSARSAYNVGDRALFRSRSRYEDENNSYYYGMNDTAATHIVGTGPRPQILSDNAEGNSRVEKAWRRWAMKNSFGAFFWTKVITYRRDGESFTLRRHKPSSNPNDVPLKLCLYEGDQVTSPYAFPLDPNVEDGIRIDQFGDPIAYHILDRHPGDVNVPAAGMLSGKWYDAADVAHLFRKRRPGQFRGIPRGASSLELFPKFRRNTLATLAAAEAVNNWTLFMRTNSASGRFAKAPSDFVTMDFARAMLTFLPEGWEPFQLKAEVPATTHEMFQRQTLMEAGRCHSMPYLLLAGTSKDSNFASAKMDVRNIWGPDVESDQALRLVPILNTFFGWWWDEAIMVPGLLDDMPPLDDFETQWQFDPLPVMDESEDATAGQTLLESGQIMPGDLYARRGRDFDTEIKRGAKAYGVEEKTLRQAIFATNYPQFALGEPDGADAVVKKPRTTPIEDATLPNVEETEAVA